MYLDNKYTKWYYNIITEAKANPFDGYTEKHHIIPKSLGGTDETDNLVCLSAKQHFICHALLTKMVDNPQHKISVNLAFYCMRRSSDTQERYTSTLFSERKLNTSGRIATDEFRKKRKQHMTGKKWYNNGTEEKYFFPDEVPEGFSKGRMYSPKGVKYSEEARIATKKAANNPSKIKKIKQTKIKNGTYYITGKKVSDGNTTYKSCSEAGRQNNKSYETIRTWAKQKKNGWFFIDNP